LVRNGVDDASSDPEQVGRWFRAYPEGELNIGLAMGEVVAIDEDESGAILAAGLELPNCPTALTSRGRHYLFRANGAGLANVVFAPGLQLKGRGGYIVAPPSHHLSGHVYSWIAGHGLGDVPLEPLPEAVSRMVAAARARGNGAAKDDVHDLFGNLDLEKAFLDIEAAEASGNGERWRRRVLQIIASAIGRMRDDMIVTLCRRATWRARGWTHQQTDEFVKAEIRRARAKFDRPGPEDDTFEQNDAELRQDQMDRLRLVPPSEMDWRGAQLNLVKGLLGFGMMALLYGASGSAKTLIALSLALHVALGRDWCGRKVRQGFAAYLAPEGAHSVHLRFHAWCRHHGIDPDKDSLPFRTIPTHVNLCTSDADLEGVIANIKAAQGELGPCVLIVVDTVSRALAGGNENAPDDMGRFVANCDRLREDIGATVLAVHHTPKGGDTPRGHSSLKNGAEIRLLARKVADGLFALETEHLKDGASGGELFFNLHSAVVGRNDDGEQVSGGLVTQATITTAGAPGRPPHLTDRQLRILQELHKEATTTRRWEFTTDEFNELCVRSGAVDGRAAENAQRARCSDLKRQLANKGYVNVASDIIRLVSRP
jgi:hypothetical protein